MPSHRKKKRRTRRSATGALHKDDLSGGDLSDGGGALAAESGGDSCTLPSGKSGVMRNGKCVARKEDTLLGRLERLIDRLDPEIEPVAKAYSPDTPWEFFSLDADGPYFHEGLPSEATLTDARGFAVLATDADGKVHAHALDGPRDEVLLGAARCSAEEKAFVSVGRAIGVLGDDTVFREIATFQPTVSKDEDGGAELEIDFDDVSTEAREKRIQVKKTSDDLQIVYGEVYAPVAFPDAHNEVMTAEEIRKMAHGFLARGRVDKIDIRHDNFECGAVVVESFIAEEGTDYIPGAWVLGVYIPSNDIWKRVKSGELNGFSMQAMVLSREKQIEVEVPEEVTGNTSESEHDDGSGLHRHTYRVKFDENGGFLGGKTSVAQGHGHDIVSMSVTDWTRGRESGEVRHRHRYSFLDKLFGGQALDEATGQAEAA